MTNDDICGICGLTRDPRKAKYVHTRIGLDEAPELALCKCKDQESKIRSILDRVKTISLEPKDFNMVKTLDLNEKRPLNSVTIRNIEKDFHTEVEVRMCQETSEYLWTMMGSGFFGVVNRETIREIGCSKWVGSPFNVIGRIRKRTNEGSVLKIPLFSSNFMPGMTLTVAREYPFKGKINKAQYLVQMVQNSVKTKIDGIEVQINSREYQTENNKTYSSEIEFLGKVQYNEIARVVSSVIEMSSSGTSMARHIDAQYMSQVRSTDHDVIDVSDVSNCSGLFTYKADGMKVYVFAYNSGYVITFTDRKLTILDYRVEAVDEVPEDVSSKPDVFVAEIMSDGSLVYIDTLAMEEEVVQKPRDYVKEPPQSLKCRPPMIVRKLWTSYEDMIKDGTQKIESDGYVCIGSYKTVRMKTPTVDLICKEGKLCATDATKTVIYGDSHPDMIENGVYEMTVTSDQVGNYVTLSNPTRRLVKEVSNPPDVVSRSFASSFKESNSTILYDIVSMSFKMRRMIYDMAKSQALGYRRVIISVGTGRFQEINDMGLDTFSYIVVDPVIDTSRLDKRREVKTVVQFDKYSSMMTQIRGITEKPGNVLYYKGTFEEFLVLGDVLKTMESMSIPTVFSFSMSFCVAGINTLLSLGVPVYGCGYIHDKMPVKGVGKKPVTMTMKRDGYGNPYVSAVFGKSTYNEPIMLSNQIPNLKRVTSVMPWVESEIDLGTKEIMERAVLLI